MKSGPFQLIEILGFGGLAPRTTRISIISIVSLVWGPQIIEIIEIGGFVADSPQKPPILIN